MIQCIQGPGGLRFFRNGDGSELWVVQAKGKSNGTEQGFQDSLVFLSFFCIRQPATKVSATKVTYRGVLGGAGAHRVWCVGSGSG